MDEFARRHFEPAAILPEQIGTRAWESLLRRPEARLMVAVMEDAIATCRRHWEKRPDRRPREFGEALAWLESTDGRWMYSFESVCEMLSLPPTETRTRLLRLLADSSPEAESIYRTMLRHQAGARHAIRPRRVHSSVARARRPKKVAAPRDPPRPLISEPDAARRPSVATGRSG